MAIFNISKEGLDGAIRDLNKTFYLPPYQGFEVAWLAIIKLADSFPDKTELDRMASLMKIIPEDKVKEILSDSAVDELLNIRPLLDTILSTPYDRLDPVPVSHSLKELIRLRAIDPRAALTILIVVLSKIRDRRVHGFQTQQGSRDEVIFRASLRLLCKFGELAAEGLREIENTGQRLKGKNN